MFTSTVTLTPRITFRNKCRYVRTQYLFGTFCVALKQFPEKQSLCSVINYKIINKVERKSDLDLMRISFVRVVFELFTCRAKTSPEPQKLGYGKTEEECHT